MSAPPRAAAPGDGALGRGFARGFRALLLVLAALAHPLPSRASTEEFSTFDVERPEEDDESLLDHALTAAPRAWDHEWRRAPMAIRTAQGCLTSGQWLNDTRLRVRAPLGERARFGVELEQSETDLASWNHLDFTFQFPQRFGTPGVSFRPFYDKSRQDFALTWETGSDTASFVARVAFTFEDMFNNLWAWRQTRVGDASEPYERHPYEPALSLGGRGERWRWAIGGKWLTPSRRREPGPPGTPQLLRTTLWGTLGEARIEVDALGLSWEASAFEKRAESSARAFLDPAGGPYLPGDSLAVAAGGDDARFRSLWRGGLAVRRVEERWSAELRGVYQSRTQTWAPPTGDGRFEALDRMLGIEVTRRVLPSLDVRAGALFDRIGVAREGITPMRAHASRDEKRLYLGLDARFGNVRVFGVEGIELDDEAYEVWFIHDKGFVGLQATF